MMEHFWCYLESCLKCLTNEQYNNAEEYLQGMAFVWNTNIPKPLGVAPFNTMTRTNAQTLANGFLAPLKEQGTLDLTLIVAMAAKFTHVARDNVEYH